MLVKDILKVVPNDELFEIYYKDTWYHGLEKEKVLSDYGNKEVYLLESDIWNNYEEYPIISMAVVDHSATPETKIEHNLALDSAIEEAINATTHANELAEEQKKIYLALNEANERARQKRAEAEQMLKDIIKAGI